MQAPETQSEALDQLIDLIPKLELELKCTISHQTFVEVAVICEEITFERSCIL